MVRVVKCVLSDIFHDFENEDDFIVSLNFPFIFYFVLITHSIEKYIVLRVIQGFQGFISRSEKFAYDYFQKKVDRK